MHSRWFFDRAVQQATQYGMQAQYIFTQVLSGIGALRSRRCTRRYGNHQRNRSRPLDGNVYSNSAVNSASGALEATSGNYTKAYDWATEAAPEARAAGFTLLEIVTEMPEAVYAVELNRIGGRTLSSVTCESYCEIRCGASLIVCSGRSRRRYLRQGERFSVEVLPETLRLAQNPRMAAFLAWAKHWLSRQLVLALETGIEVETTRQLIGRFDVEPIDATSESWPWRIRV